MLSLLKKPHPFIFNRASVLVPTLAAFLLFLLIGPFGIADMSWTFRILISLLFGLNGALGVIITLGTLILIYPRHQLEDSWNVAKEIILITSVVLTICLINFVIISLMGLSETKKADLFIDTVLKTISVCFFPVIILVLYEQYSFKKKKLQETLALNKEIEKKQQFGSENTNIQKITFFNEAGKFEISLAIEQILLLKSDGNYLEIYYLDDQLKVKKKLIRNRIKAIEGQLPNEVFFISHRSYIINTSYIQSVNGNARNLYILLRHINLNIPVARSKTKEFQELINTL